MLRAYVCLVWGLIRRAKVVAWAQSAGNMRTFLREQCELGRGNSSVLWEKVLFTTVLLTNGVQAEP